MILSTEEELDDKLLGIMADNFNRNGHSFLIERLALFSVKVYYVLQA